MRIDLQSARMTALWRYHDAALDRASLILTFSRSEYEDSGGLYDLHLRQTIRLIDLVHEFCFNARRAVERAERYKPGVLRKAQELLVHHFQREIQTDCLDPKAVIRLTDQCFWWILGRIIHSRDTMVVKRTDRIVFDDSSGTGRHWSVFQPVALAFESDRDDPDESHHVHLESLVRAYVLGLSRDIEQAIATRNHISDGA